MQDDAGLDPPERELESALRSLSPTAARIDTVSAAFEAGQRSARRQVRLWQSAAAALVLVSACIWMIPAAEHGAAPRSPAQVLAAALPRQPLPAQSIAMLQSTVREGNLVTLPPTPLPDVRSIRAGDVL